ncbi:MAG: D-alanyl-D-alanine carboxypeptidase [Acidobacteriota bacterium]
MKRFVGLGIGVALGVAVLGQAADQPLLFHAEAANKHRVLWTEGADQPFNPASVLKVATSLLALKSLGPDYRFVTDFACKGQCTIENGRLQGDLVIVGGGDPDFQAENAWLVAHELSIIGITGVTGDLVIDGVFYQGWEHGIEKRQTDPHKRARLMGGRFLQALDVTQWDRTLHATWEDAAPRHGWPMDSEPTMTFGGAVRTSRDEGGVFHPLVRHRSNPLRLILGRFNIFSNNDIIRVADPIGGPPAIAALLEEIAGELPGEIKVSTASGERVNRMTARQVVRLLWAFDEKCRDLGLNASEILPVPGCVPGSLPRMFPRLASGENARTAVVKSGTLTNTDGGVAVLAGFFRTLKGETVAFCVAAPHAGGRLKHFRLAEQEWLLDLMGSVGGADRRNCGTPLPFSDTMADTRVTRHSGADQKIGESNAAK